MQMLGQTLTQEAEGVVLPWVSQDDVLLRFDS